MAEEPQKENLAEGTLISHLLELRNRLMHAMIAVVIILVPCVYYQNKLFSFISQPLRAKLAPGVKMIATGVMAPFTVPLQLALFVSIFIAMPYILYQVWAFVAPGLYKHEKRFAIPLLLSSVLLFYLGLGSPTRSCFHMCFILRQFDPGRGVVAGGHCSYLSFAMQMFFAFASPLKCRSPWCCW